MNRTEAVVGVNWGDEGKGRMVDYFAADADVVVRYQGGNNAGHTVVNEHGKFKLNLVPSGIFNPQAWNVLGPGMVIDLEFLANELDKLEAAGIDTSNLSVSERAAICFPFHRAEDAAEEARLKDRFFGSTQRGIAPAYGDRHLKKSLLVGEALLPKEDIAARLGPTVEWKSKVLTALYDLPALSLDDVVEWAAHFGQLLKDRVTDTSARLRQAVADGKRVLFEAQLGALRDLYAGIYPYTSSSVSLAAFAPIGAGVPEVRVETVTGVVKAFSTCIGEGPFVTEMPDDQAGAMRETADEYGASTGRPRRIGHFDAVASRYGARAQGATQLALTKLDSLSGLPELRICTAYELISGTTKEFPPTGALASAVPVYEVHPGWDEDITSVREFEDLPANARDYVRSVEALVGVPVHFISVGPERSQLITLAEG